MTYIYFNFEGSENWIETEDGYAVRHIERQPDGSWQNSCRDGYLAEGEIEVDEASDVCETVVISGAEFERIWQEATSEVRTGWPTAKANYPVGKKVAGRILYFYPQGVIGDFGDVQGCADYDRCREKSPAIAMYPGHGLTGVVTGYDENNMWILIGDPVAE